MACPCCGERATKCYCDEEALRAALQEALEENETLLAKIAELEEKCKTKK